MATEFLLDEDKPSTCELGKRSNCEIKFSDLAKDELEDPRLESNLCAFFRDTRQDPSYSKLENTRRRALQNVFLHRLVFVQRDLQTIVLFVAFFTMMSIVVLVAFNTRYTEEYERFARAVDFVDGSLPACDAYSRRQMNMIYEHGLTLKCAEEPSLYRCSGSRCGCLVSDATLYERYPALLDTKAVPAYPQRPLVACDEYASASASSTNTNTAQSDAPKPNASVEVSSRIPAINVRHD